MLNDAILVVSKLVWNPSWFRLTTGIIWAQVRKFERFGACFCTCALIIWSVLLQALLRPASVRAPLGEAASSPFPPWFSLPVVSYFPFSLFPFQLSPPLGAWASRAPPEISSVVTAQGGLASDGDPWRGGVVCSQGSVAESKMRGGQIIEGPARSMVTRRDWRWIWSSAWSTLKVVRGEPSYCSTAMSPTWVRVPSSHGAFWLFSVNYRVRCSVLLRASVPLIGSDGLTYWERRLFFPACTMFPWASAPSTISLLQSNAPCVSCNRYNYFVIRFIGYGFVFRATVFPRFDLNGTVRCSSAWIWICVDCNC
jgi:hypothetical protein